MAQCKEVMRAQGEKLLPRTCPVHGLSGCPTPDKKHDGLPVAGYRAQSAANVELVNRNKQIEERISRSVSWRTTAPSSSRAASSYPKTKTSDAMIYTQRPVRVSAFQWEGPAQKEYPAWFDALIRKSRVGVRQHGKHAMLNIKTENGNHVMAKPGQWIVMRDRSVIVHADDVFKKLYMPAFEHVPQYEMPLG